MSRHREEVVQIFDKGQKKRFKDFNVTLFFRKLKLPRAANDQGKRFSQDLYLLTLRKHRISQDLRQ